MTHVLTRLPPTATWNDLGAELDLWAKAGRLARFWWRDDDAVTTTPALDRLLAIARDIPLSLAVIPGAADKALAGPIADYPNVTILQHGWRHANHAPPDKKKTEFGPDRPLRLRCEDIAAGRDRLSALFGARFLPVLAPPWNRFEPDLLRFLPGLGLIGISAIEPRQVAEPAPGLAAINVHVDLTDWPIRRFIGEEKALARIAGHLRARRLGQADPDEPTGLLTHHLVQDGATENFLRRCLEFLQHHGTARIVNAFAEAAPA
jgi:hypothetical protein